MPTAHQCLHQSGKGLGRPPGLNLVNSCNLELFDLVLIPKLNFENSLPRRSVGCVIPVFALIDWAKIKCIIRSSKKEETGTVTRGIAESA